jgi:hypothetical protein
MGPHVERIACDWSDRVEHAATWALKLAALEDHCAQAAKAGGWRWLVRCPRSRAMSDVLAPARVVGHRGRLGASQAVG